MEDWSRNPRQFGDRKRNSHIVDLHHEKILLSLEKTTNLTMDDEAAKFCGPLSLPKKEWGTVRFMSEFFKKDRREMMFLKNDPFFLIYKGNRFFEIREFF